MRPLFRPSVPTRYGVPAMRCGRPFWWRPGAIDHTAVFSGVGSLALFGVAVRTGIIMLEYSNQLRARGEAVLSAAVNGSVQRLLPIRMTMMVATLGLLPALYMWLARDGDVLPEVEREAI